MNISILTGLTSETSPLSSVDWGWGEKKLRFVLISTGLVYMQIEPDLKIFLKLRFIIVLYVVHLLKEIIIL